MKITKNIALVLGVLVVIAGLVWALWSLSSGHHVSPGGMAVAVIIGAACLVTVVLLISIIYTWLGLADRSQALALPDGSVRALIALILLSAFISVPLFLFGNVRGGMKVIDNVPADSKEAALALSPKGSVAIPDEGGKTFRIYYHDEDPASADFAKEILTALITLVASVCSFYFGAAVVQSAQAQGSASSVPTITAIDPNSGEKGKGVPVQITGNNLNNVNKVAFSNGSIRVDASEITSNPTLVKCMFRIPETGPLGKWTMSVFTGDGKSAKLEDGFEVK